MITMLLQASLPMTLGAIGPQALPPTGCAAFLWSRAERPELVAMVGADAATLRVQLAGKPVTLSRTAATGGGTRGFRSDSTYAATGVTASLTMTTAERPDLADGALVPDALLTVTPAGQDTIVVPVGGMIGCALAREGK